MRRRQTSSSTRPIDAFSRRVIEAEVHRAGGCNWAILEAYDGDQHLHLTLAGNAVKDPSTGTFYGREGATIAITDADVAEAFGEAIIRAARKAKEIGLRVAGDA